MIVITQNDIWLKKENVIISVDNVGIDTGLSYHITNARFDSN
jgi:hypothetical protein